MREVFLKLKSDFFGAFDRVEEESLRWTKANKGRVEFRLVGLILVACFMLAFLEYFGGSADFRILEKPLSLIVDDAHQRIHYTFRTGHYARLARLMYWSGCTFVGYMLIPMLYIKLVMRERLRDFGIGIKGALEHSWIYIGLFLFVLPAVYTVSFTASFQHTYPFYKDASRSALDFFLWELTYAVQFMSLEFFFRGFLVHGMKRRLGVYTVLLATVPYCMIHFGKPLPETLGASFAGIALGLLSLFTESIWLGVAIHVSVAVSMDVLSLMAQNKLHLF